MAKPYKEGKGWCIRVQYKTHEYYKGKRSGNSPSRGLAILRTLLLLKRQGRIG